MIPFEAVESFIAIVQKQTISAAAQTLFVSQSTISHRIQVLEQELRVTLFDRQQGFKKLELTEDGKRFYPLAMQWLDLNSRMHELCDTKSLGKVRIASMDSINQYLLSHVFAQIRTELPTVQMEFVSYHSQEIYSRINSQLIDVGFAFYPIRYNITAIPLFSEPMYMVSSPDSVYPEEPIHPSQLKKADQVFFTWNDYISRWNHEWWNEYDAPFVSVDSCALLVTFLTEPERWAICPASVATSLRASYGVKVHSFTEAPPNRVCYMLSRKYENAHEMPASVKAFTEAFRNAISNHPWLYKD